MPDIKKQKILDGDWDYLIILDACRYDYFKQLYKNYDNLKEGDLEKRESRGSCTAEWLYKTFTEPLPNTKYISTNPFVNSDGVPLDKSTQDFEFKWNPTEHFKEVIDLWKYSWDDKLGTVLPKEVNKSVKKNINHNKLIIHYMQPHIPYLTNPEEPPTTHSRKKIMGSSQKSKRKIIKAIKPLVAPVWSLMSREDRWKIKKLLGFEINTIGRLYLQGRVEELKKYYQENLEIVLEKVENLIEHLDGKIVITADHGEAFGERGEWSHPGNRNIPTLKEVPWLKINEGR